MVAHRDRLRSFYDRSAGHYDRWMKVFDSLLLGDSRRQLCARARGRTLELAVGTGLNLPFYDRTVALTAVDLSAAMLRGARRRASNLAQVVALHVADAEALPFRNHSFDTVVTTLLLSSLQSANRVAREVRRVLRPSGQWLLLDTVMSEVAPVRWLERLAEPALSAYAGVRLANDLAGALEGAGFVIQHSEPRRAGVIRTLVAILS